jgi:hypothetical protein
MLIARKDLESILTVMDKFGLTDEYHGINIEHTPHDGGYDLSIQFSTVISDVLCSVKVVIDSDTLGEYDE